MPCSWSLSHYVGARYALIVITDELIEAACEGDKRAQKILVDWLYDDLKATVRAAGVLVQDQEDVHHGALHDLLRKMPTHAPRKVKDFRKWAFGFGRMAVIQYLGQRGRKSKRTVFGLDPERMARAETSLLEAWHEFRLLGLLSTFLRKLPQVYRSPLMHRLRGRKDASFAERYGIPIGTIRRRRHEGRKRIRRMFEAFMRGDPVVPFRPDSPSNL